MAGTLFFNSSLVSVFKPRKLDTDFIESFGVTEMFQSYLNATGVNSEEKHKKLNGHHELKPFSYLAR